MNVPALLAVSVLTVELVGLGPSASSRQTTPAETATQVYLRFRAAVEKATRLEDITPFWGAELMSDVNMTPADQRPGILDGVKRIQARTTNVKVVKETPSPSGMTLSLEGTGANNVKMRGSVDLVKEGGAWKIAAQEQWQ